MALKKDALHLAALRGQIAVCSLLLQYGQIIQLQAPVEAVISVSALNGRSKRSGFLLIGALLLPLRAEMMLPRYMLQRTRATMKLLMLLKLSADLKVAQNHGLTTLRFN